jgi:hypothetical protein
MLNVHSNKVTRSAFYFQTLNYIIFVNNYFRYNFAIFWHFV